MENEDECKFFYFLLCCNIFWGIGNSSFLFYSSLLFLARYDPWKFPCDQFFCISTCWYGTFELRRIYRRYYCRNVGQRSICTILKFWFQLKIFQFNIFFLVCRMQKLQHILFRPKQVKIVQFFLSNLLLRYKTIFFILLVLFSTSFSSYSSLLNFHRWFPERENWDNF